MEAVVVLAEEDEEERPLGAGRASLLGADLGAVNEREGLLLREELLEEGRVSWRGGER